MACGSNIQEQSSQFESDEDVSSKQEWKSCSAPTAAPEKANGFECNICLDSANEPVVTLCGHLYCWPCIYKWLHVQSSSSEIDELPKCPVCKANISESSLVPLYGRGTSGPQFSGKRSPVDPIVPRRPPALGVHSLLTAPAPMTSSGPNQADHSSRFQPQHRHFPHPYGQFPSMASSNFGPPAMASFFSPTVGMFREMVLTRILGGTDSSLLAYHYPNSVILGTGTPRMRRQEMQLDKSLNRVSIFLFCCFILCLLLF